MIIVTSFSTSNRFKQIGNGLVIYKSFTDGNMTIECSGGSTCNTIQFTKDNQIFDHDPKNIGTISLTSGITGTKYQLYAVNEQGNKIHLFQVTVKPLYIDLGIFNSEQYSIAKAYKLIYQLLVSKKITLRYFLRYWNAIALVVNGNDIIENYDIMMDMLISYDKTNEPAYLYSAEMISQRYKPMLEETCGLYQLIAVVHPTLQPSTKLTTMAHQIFQLVFGAELRHDLISYPTFMYSRQLDWSNLALTISLINVSCNRCV